MSIQFPCPGCGQPIEVDSEHAGKVAACPYCQQVVNVPQESAYVTAPVPPARPTDTEWLAPSMDDTEQQQQKRRARVWGFCALGSLATVVVLFLALAIPLAGLWMEKMGPVATTQPNQLSPQEMEHIQAEIMKEVQSKPWFLGLSCGAELMVVVALVLSIISVVISRKGNWPGIVALVVSSLCAFCVAASVVLGAAGIGGG